MRKKSDSRAMRRILSHMRRFNPAIEVIIFEEERILSDPVESWPQCDFLVAFHSDGFPLQKAVEYVRLRKPELLCDLDRQFDILDRRKILALLKYNNIPYPETLFAEKADDIVQNGDVLTFSVGGHKKHLRKPFIEKPISAEDHNVWLYYSTAAGGGIRKLFRKTAKKSSEFFKEEWKIRRDGLYIYQRVHESDDHADVKVYTVGSDFIYAESRKAPTVDGIVDRTAQGKEVRRPIQLSDKEAHVASKVALAMKQFVCGFDLLRADGESYVIDVNGWSFVKGNEEYYIQCGQILGEHIGNRWAQIVQTSAVERSS